MAFNREQFIADLEAMTVLELKELVTALASPAVPALIFSSA